MKRVRMTRSTLGLTLNDAPSEAHHTIRGALPADGHALGEVLFLAYLGGPDQEENGEGEGRAEIARTMGGAYGPFVEAASFVAEDAEGLVGASLVTRFEGVPLLAHLVVHPRDRQLVAATHGRSVWIVDALPVQELTPAVRAEPAHLFHVDEVQAERSWRSRPSRVCMTATLWLAAMLCWCLKPSFGF